MASLEADRYAHTLSGQSPEHWELLEVHLSQVSVLTAAFASGIQSEDWGAVLGLCHDLGKGSLEFQAYLHASNGAAAENAGEQEDAGQARGRRAGSVDHKTFGARYVAQHAGTMPGELMAYCIAGHHGGLPNALSDDDATQTATLRYRLDARYPALHALPEVSGPFPALPSLRVPWVAPAVPNRLDTPFAIAFYTRMLFSCLVDADRTCTEAFCDKQKAIERQVPRPSLAELRGALERHLETLAAQAKPTAVNRVRADVLAECRAAATVMAPGFFSLQVPTGGGKTFASLMFALDHAHANAGLRRVVVAIPFTSIIEQTADAYRKALGPYAETGVLEHHTNVQPERETRTNKLATENWDAPLIVTTNVQLLESLFAAGTTPCRKLHRLAGSVIILDEAQTLPVELLAPTLRALRELVERYGCTVVLCTATQPALEYRKDLLIGLRHVRPIIAAPEALFDALRRVDVRYEGRLTDAELAPRLAAEPRVLTIVNTRAHAAKLSHELQTRSDPGTCFHLSTLMCGAHRSAVLARIREQVKQGTCRVVSTQLIEAGVDLDFPVVYRAEAGFDSLAQAAGRCNREGALPEPGVVHVFEAEKRPPPGFLADAAQVARELLPRYAADPLAPAAIEAYFRHYYWKSTDILDRKQVLPCFDSDGKGTVFQFKDAEARYKIIEDAQVPVLVPFEAEPLEEKAKKYLDDLQKSYVDFISQRLLQPYLVSIPERDANQLERSGAVQKHASGVWLLLRDDLYDAQQGLKLGDPELDRRAWNV